MAFKKINGAEIRQARCAMAPSAPAAHRTLMGCSRAARSTSRASARSQRCSGRAGASAGVHSAHRAPLPLFSACESAAGLLQAMRVCSLPAALRPSGGCVHDLTNLKIGPKSGVPSPSRCARPSSRLTSGGLRPAWGPGLGALPSFVWDKLSDRASASVSQKKESRRRVH
jgi:hypothetical protein